MKLKIIKLKIDKVKLYRHAFNKACNMLVELGVYKSTMSAENSIIKLIKKQYEKKTNCLTRALDQWADNPDIFRLWYNNNHVITLEKWYNGKLLIDDESMSSYLPLTDYGFVYFEGAFRDWLSPKYKKILLNYLDSLRNDDGFIEH